MASTLTDYDDLEYTVSKIQSQLRGHDDLDRRLRGVGNDVASLRSSLEDVRHESQQR